MMAVGFLYPWVLLGLLALPLLWWVLRSIPPRPKRRQFPAVALLLGLEDKDHQAATTPIWLIMLRMALIAALIVGFAEPVLNPDRTAPPQQRMLVVMDGGWASAQSWSARQAAVEAALRRAEAADQPAALLVLTDPDQPRFVPPRDVGERLRVLAPAPYLPDLSNEAVATVLPEGAFDTVWITGGLDWPGRQALLEAVQERGTVQLMVADHPIWALSPARLEGNDILLSLHQAGAASAPPRLWVEGTDPSGRPVRLAEAGFEADGIGLQARLTLEPEEVARIRRFRLEAVPGPAGVVLADAQLRRPEIGLVTAQRGGERIELLDPKHYLRAASAQIGRVIEAPLPLLLEANPDAIILAEDTQFTGTEAALRAWLNEGGVLIRFASAGLIERAAQGQELFLPVALRQGGRALGGALTWDDPRGLAPFDQEGPFAGLDAEADLQVLAQALAVPGPDITEAALATLEDGTPLITARSQGQGRTVLFHIGANAEWSNLPLTGLFPQMLSRLVQPRLADTEPQALQGTTWRADQVMDGRGQLRPAPDGLSPVAGEGLAQMPVSATMPPGIWRSGERQVVRNLLTSQSRIEGASWAADLEQYPLIGQQTERLKPYLLVAAALLLLLDSLASLALSGRRLRGSAAVVLVLLMLPALPVQAQSEARPPIDPAVEAAALAATSEMVLAHVLTGDDRLDRMASEGLAGLSQVLTLRTSVEPGPPRAVDVEQDDLSFYPILYWPISATQPPLSEAAYDRLTAYLASGGVIVFDTRDGDLGTVETEEARLLRELAAPLPVPPLVPIPADHVLTRAFYLLTEMPGRQSSGTFWVAQPAPAGPTGTAAQNDGVSPVIIGGGDWAAAWARGEDGQPLYPMAPGMGAERQREISYRFGVNLVMYVLTGNYKSDQVHVPALLERLGQ